MGLIQDNDLSYREEVKRLVDLILNVEKTKEMNIDFRRTQPSHSPLSTDDRAVEVVSSTTF